MINHRSLKRLIAGPFRSAAKCLRGNRDVGYIGDYPDWSSARAASTGYESDEILNKVSAALLKVRDGQAVYERDSVLFTEPQYSWPVAAALLWCASRNGNVLEVIDFGGSLGSSYFQNRPFLRHLGSLRWNIVEQQNYVALGRTRFEDEILRFYPSISSCPYRPNLVLFSSTLQYLENPYEILGEAICSGADMIVVDRTVFVSGYKDQIKMHVVPAEIFSARLPVWMFAEHKFIEFMASHFEVFSRFPSYLSAAPFGSRNGQPEELGFIFVRRDTLPLSPEKTW